MVEWRLLNARSTTAADRMIESAYGVDLVVMAQEAPDSDRPDQRGVQETVIKNSGRPVLVVPRGYMVDEIGRTLVIGWSATREAARAAHDLLYLTQPNANARVLIAGIGAEPDADQLATAKEMSLGLERHGLSVNLVPLAITAHTVAEELQIQADAVEADLIVTGGFGHSRLYDFVYGAVTHELLRTQRTPVLFSK